MIWLALLIVLLPWPAWAGEAKPLGEDPAVEARLKHLAIELRCLVCQNQTLADSNAPLAEDLRREVRDMIVKNMSDKEITDFLVERYSDFVLYRPPVRATTVLLWVGPFVLLIVGVAALIITVRRRSQKLVDAPVTDEEHRRVEQLLAEGGKRS